jgi:hypothetical protein
MGRPKKISKNFNQYTVYFDFYYLTTFSKKKSVLKLHLFSPEKSPDASIQYIYSIVSKAFKDAFGKIEFNKNVIRFEKFIYMKELSPELSKNNFGFTDEDKVHSLMEIFKKHLLT